MKLSCFALLLFINIVEGSNITNGCTQSEFVRYPKLFSWKINNFNYRHLSGGIAQKSTIFTYILKSPKMNAFDLNDDTEYSATFDLIYTGSSLYYSAKVNPSDCSIEYYYSINDEPAIKCSDIVNSNTRYNPQNNELSADKLSIIKKLHLYIDVILFQSKEC